MLMESYIVLRIKTENYEYYLLFVSLLRRGVILKV